MFADLKNIYIYIYIYLYIYRYVICIYIDPQIDGQTGRFATIYVSWYLQLLMEI